MTLLNTTVSGFAQMLYGTSGGWFKRFSFSKPIYSGCMRLFLFLCRLHYCVGEHLQLVANCWIVVFHQCSFFIPFFSCNPTHGNTGDI